MINGNPISYISYFNSDSCCFIGSFITAPEERKKGYGKRLWDYALSEVHTKVGLYGVPAMINSYNRSGFAATGIIRRITFTLPEPSNTSVFLRPLMPLSTYKINAIYTFDQELTGVARKPLLEAFINDYAHTITTTEIENDKCSGYGFLRLLSEGFRLSLYALNEVCASLILKSLIESYLHRADFPREKSKAVIVDLPEEQIPCTTKLLEDLGYIASIQDKQSFMLCTMFYDKSYHGNSNPMPKLAHGCFGLLSLEAG